MTLDERLEAISTQLEILADMQKQAGERMEQQDKRIEDDRQRTEREFRRTDKLIRRLFRGGNLVLKERHKRLLRLEKPTNQEEAEDDASSNGNNGKGRSERRKPGPKGPSLHDHRAIIRLLRQGRTPAEIARQLGCARSLVYYVLGRRGYQTEAKRRYKRIPRKEVPKKVAVSGLAGPGPQLLLAWEP